MLTDNVMLTAWCGWCVDLIGLSRAPQILDPAVPLGCGGTAEAVAVLWVNHLVTFCVEKQVSHARRQEQ